MISYRDPEANLYGRDETICAEPWRHWVLGAFGREPYFAERRFHLSVAEGDDDDDDRSRSLDGSDASSDSDSDAGGDVVDVDVDAVIVKAGHRRFEIPLECV